MRKQFIYILICLFVATALFVSAEVQSYAAPKRGDVIKFGRADQDGSAKNGKEPIYWTVLSNEDGQITAISRDILYCLVYKQEDEVDNLIYNFRKAAFTENEKGKLDDIELPSLELIRSLTNRKARWTKTAQASANNLRNRLKKNNGLKSYSGAWWDKY
ncbi:MAG: hypothetical protein J5758_04485, partial [Abditibacteriota bacterium]|nr:hypothetical protein [Abditibacteriota bacterium]